MISIIFLITNSNASISGKLFPVLIQQICPTIEYPSAKINIHMIELMIGAVLVNPAHFITITTIKGNKNFDTFLNTPLVAILDLTCSLLRRQASVTPKIKSKNSTIAKIVSASQLIPSQLISPASPSPARTPLISFIVFCIIRSKSNN